MRVLCRSIMDVDGASWWRQTSENFFDRISKGSILALLADVGGAALTARHATMKKSEISESCAKLFAGEAIVEPEVRDAALAWVPDAMRFLDKTEADDLEPAEGDPEEQAIVEPEDAEEVGAAGVDRSEEHTSELQSLMRISYAGFCLKK